jgi:hypothetical protein
MSLLHCFTIPTCYQQDKSMMLLVYISPMATSTSVNIFPLRSRPPTSLHLSSNLILSFLRPFDDLRNSALSIRRNLISVPPPESRHGQFMSSFRVSERMLVLLCIPWSGEQALMAVKLFMSSFNQKHSKTTVDYD